MRINKRSLARFKSRGSARVMTIHRVRFNGKCDGSYEHPSPLSSRLLGDVDGREKLIVTSRKQRNSLVAHWVRRRHRRRRAVVRRWEASGNASRGKGRGGKRRRAVQLQLCNAQCARSLARLIMRIVLPRPTKTNKTNVCGNIATQIMRNNYIERLDCNYFRLISMSIVDCVRIFSGG